MKKKGSENIQTSPNLGNLLPNYKDKRPVSQSSDKVFIYAALANNLSAPKNPSLFDDIDGLREKDKDLIERTDKELEITRNYMPIYNTPLQSRIIAHFIIFLSQFQFDEEVIKVSSHLNEIYQAKDKNFYTPIARRISILEFSKAIFKSGRTRDRERMYNEIEKISKINQAIKIGYNDNKGNRHTYTQVNTLINIDGTTIGYSDGIAENIGIIFHPLFFDRIVKFKAPFKPFLESLWNEKEIANNPIFPPLLFTLSANYWRHICKAKDKEKELKGIYTEDKEEDIKLAMLEELTFPLDTATIRDKTQRDYTSSRKAKREFFPHLQIAIDYLIRYGIITKDTYITEAKDSVHFVFNINFENQTKALQKIIKP